MNESCIGCSLRSDLCATRDLLQTQLTEAEAVHAAADAVHQEARTMREDALREGEIAMLNNKLSSAEELSRRPASEVLDDLSNRVGMLSAAVSAWETETSAFWIRVKADPAPLRMYLNSANATIQLLDRSCEQVPIVTGECGASEVTRNHAQYELDYLQSRMPNKQGK